MTILCYRLLLTDLLIVVTARPTIMAPTIFMRYENWTRMARLSGPGGCKLFIRQLQQNIGASIRFWTAGQLSQQGQ